MKEDFVSSQNISIRYDVKTVISLCFFSQQILKLM
jgi:hypothetical protein